MTLRHKAIVDYTCVPHDTFAQWSNFEVLTSRSIIEDGNLFSFLGERSKGPENPN